MFRIRSDWCTRFISWSLTCILLNDTNDDWEEKAFLVGEAIGEVFGGEVAISYTERYIFVDGHMNDAEDAKQCRSWASIQSHGRLNL